jgi:hypothetical protein
MQYCTQLAYYFSTTEEELLTVSEGFNSVSQEGAIDKCVACIKGFLLRIKVPLSKEVGHSKSFFQATVLPME